MRCPYPECDFESSEKGVKMHHSRTHGSSIAGVVIECDNCGTEKRRKACVVERNEHTFCSPQCRGKHRAKTDRLSGSDNPAWKGGSSKDMFTLSDAGKAWRKAVFQRDNYTCQDCGDDSGGNLQAHHIKRRAECEVDENGVDEKYAIWNGVTLCYECHTERHKGEQIYEAMKSKISGD